jgi:hypothetical protein
MAFTIGMDEIAKRRKNIFLGLIFSAGLVVILGYMNGSDSTKYNDLLLGSVVFFMVFANIINGFRYLQWLKMITTHRIEPEDGVLHFFKGETKSTLKAENIARIGIKKKQDKLAAITVELNIGNKIRLEGYDDMDGLLTAMKNIVKDDVIFEDG